MLNRATPPHAGFSYSIYLGCLIALGLITFNVQVGRDIFYVCSYLTFIAFCLHTRYFLRNKALLAAPIMFFAVGMGSIFWLQSYKQPGDYINIYRAYMASGKLLLATAFILMFALNERHKLGRPLGWLVLIFGLLVNSYALYQGLYQHLERVELNYDRATIAAYVMTAIDLLMLQAILVLIPRYRPLCFVLAFMLSFAAIILTGTRVTMMAYPLLGLLLFLCYSGLNTRHKKRWLLAIVLFTGLSVVLFKPMIETRIDAFRTDITHLAQTDRENSIGARLSMYRVGLQAGNHGLLGQSAEHRAERALSMIEQDASLSGAKPYLTVHMHDELIETYSIKGLWGVMFLLGLYVALLFTATKLQPNMLLLAISAAMIVYGISDVIFFSSEGTTIFGLAIILSVLINPRSTQSANQR